MWNDQGRLEKSQAVPHVPGRMTFAQQEEIADPGEYRIRGMGTLSGARQKKVFALEYSRDRSVKKVAFSWVLEIRQNLKEGNGKVDTWGEGLENEEAHAQGGARFLGWDNVGVLPSRGEGCRCQRSWVGILRKFLCADGPGPVSCQGCETRAWHD